MCAFHGQLDTIIIGSFDSMMYLLTVNQERRDCQWKFLIQLQHGMPMD